MYVSPASTGASRGGGSRSAATSAVAAAAGRLDRLPWPGWQRPLLMRFCAVGVVAGLFVGAAVSSTTVLVGGVCAGALGLGRLADRFGRRQLLLISVAVSVLAGAAAPFTGPAWLSVLWVGALGAGAGGTLAALTAGVAELAPTGRRGRWTQVVTGSCWLGVAAGAALQAGVPGEKALEGTPPGGPHLASGVAACVGVLALVAARKVPESPRWLWSRGRVAEANLVVAQAERQVGVGTAPVADDGPIDAASTGDAPAAWSPSVAAQRVGLLVPSAAVAGTVVLPASAAWRALDGGPVTPTALPVAALAAAGFLGPLVLGRLADTAGRRFTVLAAYLAAGLTLAAIAGLVLADVAGPLTLVLGWCVAVLMASAGCGAALTAAVETAPLGRRATTGGLSVAVISAVAVTAQVSSGHGTTAWTVTGWFVATALLAAGAVVAWRLLPEGARRPLEHLTPPPGHPPGDVGAAGSGVSGPAARSRTPHPRRPVHASHRVGRSGYAAWTSTSTMPGDDPRRVADVARLLQAIGAETLARHDLEARVGTPSWQPGRFRVALRTALEAGQVVEVAPGRFARPEQAPRSGE